MFVGVLPRVDAPVFTAGGVRMRRLLLLAWVVLAAHVHAVPAAAAVPSPRTQTWQHAAPDWTTGTFGETYLADVALRLLPGHAEGSYLAEPLEATTPFTALLAEWRAHVERTHTVVIDLRTSVDGQTWDEWQPLVPFGQREQTASQLVAWGTPRRWLQYRVRMTAQFGSPALDAVTLSTIDAANGPALVDAAPRPLPPPANPRPSTDLLAPPAPPQAIGWEAWAGVDPMASAPHQPLRMTIAPVAATNAADPFGTLRALRWAAQRRWRMPDVPFHLLLDEQGRLYNGAVSLDQQVPDADAGVIHVGVLTDGTGAMSDAARAQLTDLIAWLAHSRNLRLANIEAAANVPASFSAALDEARNAADKQTVRWQRMFVGGADAGTLALFNPGSSAAHVTLAALGANGAEERSIDLPAAQRTDVALAALFPSAAEGVVIKSNRVLHAERTTDAGTQVLSGAAESSRSWYFAAASTIGGTDTVLHVFNPAAGAVDAQLVLFDGGDPFTSTATLAPQGQTVLPLGDVQPNAQFGVQLVTTESVVAEQVTSMSSGAVYTTTGSAALEQRWSFAQGMTTAGYTTTLQILNPWPQRVALTLQIMSEDGTSLTRRYAAPPAGRLELVLNDLVPDLVFVFTIVAERPIAAERLLVTDGGTAATASSGVAAPATRWTFAAGTTVGVDHTLVVGNAQRSATDLDVRYVLADGSTITRRYRVPPMARLTIRANDDVPDQQHIATIVIADQPVVVERTLVAATPSGTSFDTRPGDSGR